MLRVRTRPECPEDSLRELTLDSKPNCWIAREREKKRKTKELGAGTCLGEGVIKEEKFPNTRKPSHRQVCGEFWSLRGKHNRQGKKKKKKPTD